MKVALLMDSVSRNAGGLYDAVRRLGQSLQMLGEEVRVLGVEDERTSADLAGWTPRYEAPVTLDRDGWTLAKAGPWSQGPALLQAIAMLDEPTIESCRRCACRGCSPPGRNRAGRPT